MQPSRDSLDDRHSHTQTHTHTNTDNKTDALGKIKTIMPLQSINHAQRNAYITYLRIHC